MSDSLAVVIDGGSESNEISNAFAHGYRERNELEKSQIPALIKK
ncbi:hypothetical protein [Litchfieldia alkalitelluris]|nr:hypothetical protein [Litchfieldia alkalitelluris]